MATIALIQLALPFMTHRPLRERIAALLTSAPQTAFGARLDNEP